MPGSRKTAFSAARSVAEMVEIFESSDLGADWERMPEADFEIDLKKSRHLVTLDEDLVERLGQVARTRHVSSQALVNIFLREKLADAV